MIVKERIRKLQGLMQERKMDAYIIPTSDFHETEYVGEYFKARYFMSGFSGSAGVMIVTKKQAFLWTDGRYFLQAEKELAGSGIELMRQGMSNVPSIVEFLGEEVNDQGCIGFDGRVMNTAFVKSIANRMNEYEQKNVIFQYQEDLVDMIWKDRPALPCSQAFILDEKHTGRSAEDKVSFVRQYMKSKRVDYQILTKLDDLAWLLNLRGQDIPCFPVIMAYAFISLNDFYLYVDERKVNEQIQQELKRIGITIKPYNQIYEDVKALRDVNVILDDSTVNYQLTQSLHASVLVVNDVNIEMYEKAKKNTIEIENTRNAHIKDGVAITKFMYWLKRNIGKIEMSEMSAAIKLESLRKEMDGYIEPSFETISAYQDHAAMLHYQATSESDVSLQAEGLFLVDSGGQYYDGTTDITRTFVLGPIVDEVKLHFTAVLKGLIRLSKVQFLYGIKGYNLDILARAAIWELNIDYRSGTGHGVGHVLNVHEKPNNISWQLKSACVLEEGMIQSNEPGVYIDGSHGIRLENEMVVQKGMQNSYGQFMHFETITLAPFDLEGVDITMLSESEKDWLNNYHYEVYEKISPYLNDDERVWLQAVTTFI